VSTRKKRNRNRYPGDPTQAAQERLIGYLLAAAGPTLSRDAAQALLEQAGVWTFIPMRQLDQHLATQPNALTDPDPHAPKSLLRLIYAMHAAGLEHAVTLPRCAGCDRAVPDLAARGRPHPDGIGRCCQACMTKVELIRCARCGRQGARSARRPEGVICRSCYEKDPDRQLVAPGAGEPAHRPAAPRTERRCVKRARPAPTIPASCVDGRRPPMRSPRRAGSATPATGHRNGSVAAADGYG
jgi:hypothetical protein